MSEAKIEQARIEQARPITGARSSFWRLDQANTRRSLLFCGVGAIVGLAVAGFGLFTAEGTRTFVVPPEDAATVNNVPILMADLVGQLRSLYDVSLAEATPEQRSKVLGDMIREELYVQRGVELGLPGDDIDVRQALVGGAEAAVSQDAMTARPSNEELRAWYNAHKDTYAGEGQMTVQEFVLPGANAGDAAKVAAALRDGSSPADLELKGSGRVADGAEFYFAAKLHLGNALFAVARPMRDGDVSDPVIQPDGAHILVMKRNQQPLPVRYEDAQDRVLRDFLADKVARLQVSNERFLRTRADIKIAPELR
jgi:hypothetical protein